MGDAGYFHSLSGDNGVLPYSYDPSLVAISVLIAVLASYVALHFAARLTTTRGRERFGLLLCGAVAMGTGIWSMHFVAMLAFSLPIPMFYDVPTVVLSHLAAVLAAGVALHVVSREAMGLKSWLLGSVLMGSGIGAMHYTGMLAIRLSGAMHHDPMMVALSVIVAVVVAMVALRLQFAHRAEAQRTHRSAVLMGLAIPGLHYTAMAGASFTGAGVLGDTSHAMNVSHLGSAVLILGTVTILVLGLALVIVSGNKRREALLRRYDLILNNGLDCVITLDHEGRVVEFNPAAEKTFGYPKADVLGKNLAELIIPPAQREAHRCCGITHCVATDEEGVLGRRVEITALRADGSGFPAELAVTRILLDGLPLFSAHLRDITDRRAAENSLREARGRLDHLLGSSPSIIYATGAKADGRCTFVSRNLLETVGYAPEEMMADPEFWLAHLHPEDRATVLAHFAREAVPERGSIEYRFRHADGSYHWFQDSYRLVRDEAGHAAEIVGSWTDITARKAAEEKASSREERIHYLAYHDPLTDLPNRSLLLDRLRQALAQAERDRTQVAVLFTDLDRFKIANDTLGHPAGDELLRQVALRLRSVLREGDTIARLSGDEFVILLPRISEARDVARVAAKALGIMTAPFTVLGHELHISTTIGVTLFPKDGADPEILLKHADTALYQAKDRGRNQYQFFDARMNAHAQERLLLENGLRRALEREEFVLHYQPQIDLQTNAVTGVEALIRWHPEQRMVLPGEFIPIAEETGLITEIGEWVLRTACRQAREWEAAGLPPVRMAVNLSIRQLRRGDFPALVRAILRETGLAPQRLELEITESSLMVDPEQIIKTLHELRGMGIQLAMDDLGTGYSSLAYLKRLPLDRIKIDRSFVRDIPEDPDDVAIVQAILAMAKQLEIRVVAEGVETSAQRRFLRDHRCEEAQGYAFSRPLPAEACADFLAQTPRRGVCHEDHHRAVK